MPTPRRLAGTSTRIPAQLPAQQRAMYTRTDGDLLTGGYGGPGINPSSEAPVWWLGFDTGSGAYPIGPHGPHSAAVQPGVTRLISLITGPLSSVPWKQVELGFGGDVLSTPRWINDPQLLRPDSRFDTVMLPAVHRLPRASFWSSWIRLAVVYGMGALIFTEDADGQPVAGSLRTLSPYYVRPVRDDRGALVWEIGDGGDAMRTDRDGYLQVGALRWRVVVLRDPNSPIDAEGRSISVLERHAETFGIADEIGTYMAGVYTGGGVPNGILKVQTPGLTQEQATALKQSWWAAHGTQRGVGVLNSTTDWIAVSRSPIDTALMEGKRANLADLSMAFALDPNGALGISMGNSATYVSAQAWFQRHKGDLLPWITAVEETVSSLLPQGRGIRMDFSDLTRPDPGEQYAALKIALDAHLLTLDEARNVLGLPALPTPPPESEIGPGPASESAPSPEPVTEQRHLRLQPWRG